MLNRILSWILGTIVVFALAWTAIAFLAPFIAGGVVVYILGKTLIGSRNQVPRTKNVTPHYPRQ
jgi:hypothetical protein